MFYFKLKETYFLNRNSLYTLRYSLATLLDLKMYVIIEELPLTFYSKTYIRHTILTSLFAEVGAVLKNHINCILVFFI